MGPPVAISPADKAAWQQLADRGKNYSGEAFFGCDDPLESVVFPVLLEIRKVQDGDVTGVDT